MDGYPDHNFPAFDAAARRLRDRGFSVISPAEITRSMWRVGLPAASTARGDDEMRAAFARRFPDEAERRAKYLRADVSALLSCDAVVLLPGWSSSRGATLELLVAVQTGRLVYVDAGGDLLPLRFTPDLVARWHFLAESGRASPPSGPVAPVPPVPSEEEAPLSVCREADAAVRGPRQQAYGGPRENFERIAGLWREYLGKKFLSSCDLGPDDVASMMILLKLARLMNGYHRDSVVDVAGYAACWELLSEEKP